MNSERKLLVWIFILGASLIALSSCSTENTHVYTLNTNVSPAMAILLQVARVLIGTGIGRKTIIYDRG